MWDNLFPFVRIGIGDKMKNRLLGKKVLITGATGGIGERLAYHITKQGATPILIGRNQDKLDKIRESLIHMTEEEPICYVGDLTDRTFISTTVESNPDVDVLINNAGIGLFAKLESTSNEAIEQMLLLNIHALVYLTKSFLPTLKENKGHIIQIASMAGKVPTPKSSIYAATKAFVIQFSNALRMECQEHDIAVTTVNLGPVRTGFFDYADQTGNYRKSVDNYMLDPDKVARTIVKSIYTNKREINLPFWMQIGSKWYAFMPQLMEKVLQPLFRKK